MLLAVGVGKQRRPTQHGRAEDVDPAGQRHVEGRLAVRLGQLARHVQLMHEARRRLEVLIPRNIGQTVVRPAHGTLEEDHSQRGLEDLSVVRVALERVAELGDGGVAVSHDVAVDLFALQALRALEVQRRDAEAAVQVAPVALQCRQDHRRPRRALLCDLEHGEDESQDVLDEMVQQRPVALVHVNDGLLGEGGRVVREGTGVKLQPRRVRVLAQQLLRVGLWQPGVGRKGGQRQGSVGERRRRRRLQRAKGRDGRVASCGNVVDEHLPFRVDVDLVGGVGAGTSSSASTASDADADADARRVGAATLAVRRRIERRVHGTGEIEIVGQGKGRVFRGAAGAVQGI